MKTKIITVIALFFLGPWPVRSDESMKTTPDSTTPAASYSMLEKQAAGMEAAVQVHDVHPLHEIDHAVADETSALQKSEPTLPADRKTKLDGLLNDIAKQAHRAHMDGHKANWDDAAAAQRQFAADVKEAKAIVPAAQ
jgi:hypothetical protein